MPCSYNFTGFFRFKPPTVGNRLVRRRAEHLGSPSGLPRQPVTNVRETSKHLFPWGLQRGVANCPFVLRGVWGLPKRYPPWSLIPIQSLNGVSVYVVTSKSKTLNGPLVRLRFLTDWCLVSISRHSIFESVSDYRRSGTSVYARPWCKAKYAIQQINGYNEDF